MEKLIRVIDNNIEYLDKYLSDGWTIKQISACRCESCSTYSMCYVVIEI